MKHLTNSFTNWLSNRRGENMTGGQIPSTISRAIRPPFNNRKKRQSVAKQANLKGWVGGNYYYYKHFRVGGSKAHTFAYAGRLRLYMFGHSRMDMESRRFRCWNENRVSKQARIWRFHSGSGMRICFRTNGRRES